MKCFLLVISYPRLLLLLLISGRIIELYCTYVYVHCMYRLSKLCFVGGVVYFYIIVIIMESRLLSMKSGLQKRKREHLVIFLTV